MNIRERLVHLYEMLGIDCESVMTKGEIESIIAGLECIREPLEEIEGLTAKRLFEYPSKTVVNRDFSSFDFFVTGRNINFAGYDDTVGKICRKYFLPVQSIYLDGYGLSWLELESESLSFGDIDNRYFRWSMIESRCLNE